RGTTVAWAAACCLLLVSGGALLPKWFTFLLTMAAANGLVPFSRAAQASWAHALATYYVGTPTSGNGDGSSGNPWNQTGFDAATILGTDTISINSGFTLASAASKLDLVTVTGTGNLNVTGWTGQDLSAVSTGLGAFNVTASNGFTGGLWRIASANTLTIPAGASGNLSQTLTDLSPNGFVVNGTVGTLSATDAATMAAFINGTGTLNLRNYTSQDLSGLANISTVYVTTDPGAVLDADKLALADRITIGEGTATGAAAVIDTLGDSKIIVSSGATLDISGYTTQTLGGMTNNGTINVTTANGAVLDATNLADATSITLGSGTTASSTATAIDALGPSRITVTGATLNISDTAANLAASSTAALTLGTSVAVTGTTAAAADLNTTDGKISVALNATSLTMLTGTAAQIATAISASTINTASNVGVTIDAGSAAASDLNTIDTNTTAVVNATAVSTITGLVAEVKTAIASAGITTATNYAATLSDASVSVSDANSVDADTTGVVTATITPGGVSTLNGLTGTGNAYTVTVTDSSVNAADLNT
ncbi:MAG: hypothetical protein EBZ75_14325, partial [Oxalobacteraceae bacterium]|nr:hypothetical protein [Oxalobacteraceae bacterium]